MAEKRKTRSTQDITKTKEKDWRQSTRSLSSKTKKAIEVGKNAITQISNTERQFKVQNPFQEPKIIQKRTKEELKTLLDREIPKPTKEIYEDPTKESKKKIFDDVTLQTLKALPENPRRIYTKYALKYEHGRTIKRSPSVSPERPAHSPPLIPINVPEHPLPFPLRPNDEQIPIPLQNEPILIKEKENNISSINEKEESDAENFPNTNLILFLDEIYRHLGSFEHPDFVPFEPLPRQEKITRLSVMRGSGLISKIGTLLSAFELATILKKHIISNPNYSLSHIDEMYAMSSDDIYTILRQFNISSPIIYTNVQKTMYMPPSPRWRYYVTLVFPDRHSEIGHWVVFNRLNKSQSVFFSSYGLQWNHNPYYKTNLAPHFRLSLGNILEPGLGLQFQSSKSEICGLWCVLFILLDYFGINSAKFPLNKTCDLNPSHRYDNNIAPHETKNLVDNDKYVINVFKQVFDK